MTLILRWLGTAGFDLDFGTTRLLLDPFLTRIPLHRYWFGKVSPDPALAQRYIERADAILVSHAHIDHLFDVPVIAKRDGIPVYGSANTCDLLSILGVNPAQLHEIQPGSQFRLGNLSISVGRSRHIRTPFFRPGRVNPEWTPPLKARQYVMDYSYYFRIQSSELALLTESGANLEETGQAEVLFINPIHNRLRLRQVLEKVQPKVVIPSHWDEFWSPVDQPARPMLLPPGSFHYPFQRLNLIEMSDWMKTILPGVSVVIPERFKKIILDPYLV